jgi:hypothetical protein
MLKLALAAFVGLSFVSVQGHLQRVKGVAAAVQLASPAQPASPLPHVSLGSGTTRAIEKDRQLPPLDQCGIGQLAFSLPGSSPHAFEATGGSPSRTSSPPLHLRI